MATQEITQLSPAFIEKNVPILFSSNDEFVPYMSVMIQSIIEHSSSSYNYDIIVLYSDISAGYKEKLEEIQRPNFSIRFFDVSPLCKKYQLYTGISDHRLTREAYYRLFAGQVLSEDYHRAIYCDGDMVALVDLGQLLDQALDGKYLAAPRDITGIAYSHMPGTDRAEYRRKQLGLKDPDNYFISGLLVLNLDLIRKDFPGSSLIELAASRDWLQHDQDVLNTICKDGTAELLHASWNVLQDYGNNRFLPKPLMEEWLESERSPYVIHYGGGGKPWKKDVIRQNHFWNTAASTTFFDTIIFSMVSAEQIYTDEEKEQLHADIRRLQQRIIHREIEPARNAILAELARIAAERRPPIPENPLISVIITVYKVEPYLKKCIESVINQTYQNLEIILVDDGSPDRCGAICDEYAAKDARIRVIHKENGGPSSARNVGLAAAKGDYIGWVDGDDWIAVDMYEYLINGAKKYRTPIIICGFVNVKRGQYSSRYRKADQVLTTQDALQKLFVFEIRNYQSDRIWARSIYDNIAFEEGVIFEDTRITYRLFERARWITLLKRGKYYRLQRDDSIVNTYSIKNKLQACQANVIRYQDIKDRWPALRSIHLKETYRAIQRMREAIVKSPAQEFRLYAAEIKSICIYLRENYQETLASLETGRLGKVELSLISKGRRSTFLLSLLPVKLGSLKENFLKFKRRWTKKKFKSESKKIAQKLLPAYRVSLRLEKKLLRIEAGVKRRTSSVESAAETVFWLQSVKPGETMEAAKKRVFLEMPNWGGEIALLQKGNNYLLKRLKQICLTHNLSFWILGGTLLGAVRHKGFIPWDDDIDVGMMRQEMEKLIEIIPQYPELRLSRYFHSPGPWQCIKLTLAEELSPFWIDILLYDYAGDRTATQKELWDKIQKIRSRTVAKVNAAKKKMKLTYRDEVIYDQKDAELVDQIFDSGLLTLPTVFHQDYIYRSIDCVCGKWQQLFPCERMTPFCQLEFEGEFYPAPKDYEWYLRLQYGDYFSIPKDVGHMHTRFVGDKIEYAGEILKSLEKEAYGGVS